MKRNKKRNLMVLAGALVIIPACTAGMGEFFTSDEYGVAPEAVVEVQEETKVEVTQEVEEVEEFDEQGFNEQIALMILQDNFERVDFDANTKEYMLYSSDMFDVAVGMMTFPDYEMWAQLQDAMASLSQNIYEVVGEGYTVHLVNPQNTNLSLLSFKDGVMIYSAF